MASNSDRRADNLALVFQEIFTVGERLRANRQAVADSGGFRHQIREALKSADQEARKRGYTGEDVQLAIFAVVAFLDESILNLRNPIFADWPARPLQEELFKHHIAGEVFFQNLQKLMARDESHHTADVLEMYQLSLLLGFTGRYSVSGRGDLSAITRTVGEKIQRIRQSPPLLSPMWQVPGEQVAVRKADSLAKVLLFSAAGCLLLVIFLFVGYKMALNAGISSMESLAVQGRS